MMTTTLLRHRRSQYALGRNLPVPHSETDALIREAIRQAPSAFNSQSSRAVILFADAHRKLWNIAKETLRAIVPAGNFASTDARIDGFAAGAGTVLFFEDQDAVAKLQSDYAAYAENFPIWSEQASGMAQLAVWTALTEIGIGASLQHYNPLIDAEIAATWNIPTSWKLRAQMPFGSNEQPIGDKTFMDDAERFRTFG